MNGRPRLETTLLAGVAACVFFGGGLGCEPELEGTDLRVASYDGLSYAAFYGKKPPGNGWAVLPYPYVPTASISATVGAVNPRYFDASENAEGCLSFRSADDPLVFLEVCLTYLYGASNIVQISSNLSDDTAQCMATGARMRLVDTGGNVEAYYTCPGGMETQLESVSSQWNVGEKWFMAFGGYDLGKGAEVGFSELSYQSNGPFEDSDDGDIAYDTFRAFSSGIEAYKYFSVNNNSSGAVQAFFSQSYVTNAFMWTDQLGAFPGTSVEKRLGKSYKTSTKLVQGFGDERYGAWLKKFPKIAEEEACAMEEEVPFFD